LYGLSIVFLLYFIFLVN